MEETDPLQKLSFADPSIAKEIRESLGKRNVRLSGDLAHLLADEVTWALSEEYAFGRTLAEGYIGLLGSANPDKVQIYKELVRKAGKTGPTLARIMAEHLVPVFIYGDEALLESFLDAVSSMQKKGTYTLAEPLKAVTILLDKGDIKTCFVYLKILKYLFSRALTYGESRHFAHMLPKAVLSFPTFKRAWQAEQLYRIILEDYHLIDPFLAGMGKGLSFLLHDALKEFVSICLKKIEKDKSQGIKLLSLESRFGADTLLRLRTAVPLSDVRQQLARYIKAKTGTVFSICPLSQMPKNMRREILNEYGDSPFVFSDGKFIYLPDEISLFDNYDENRDLYKCLVRLESGYHEFNSFEFDFEKTLQYCDCFKDGDAPVQGKEDPGIRDITGVKKECSDLEKFFEIFAVKALASDLFNIFEQGRLRIISQEKYPGLVRISYPLLFKEAWRIWKNENPEPLLFLLYMRIALGKESPDSIETDVRTTALVNLISGIFKKTTEEERSVETCASLVFQTYGRVEALLNEIKKGDHLEDYRPFKMPFGRRLRPDLYFSANKKYEEMGKRIKAELEKRDIHVFKSEIIRRLVKNNGDLSKDDIREIIIASRDFSDPDRNNNKEIQPEFSLSLFPDSVINREEQAYPDDDPAVAVFRYREWDTNLCDYLNDHVRVQERNIEGFKSDFYINTLNRYGGTVKRIRREFELLKPEDIKILKKWIDGEEFDTCALIDHAIDKKAGMVPSDRLYTKRIKQYRDIAALLLVDLSRSTSALVMEANKSVHEIIKEAVVLFCEALNVAGDKFAVAGFSGTGRLGVDYYTIKDFSESMDDRIRQRINAVFPQRRTRMGAAIRHATRQLEKTASKVRLLLIISDGFPNDTGYKQNYAVEDTRMAVFEAHSKKIFVRAITVDAAPDSRLDDLYGQFHHNVISDVRELPDRLLRIYGTLTRQ